MSGTDFGGCRAASLCTFPAALKSLTRARGNQSPRPWPRAALSLLPPRREAHLLAPPGSSMIQERRCSLWESSPSLSWRHIGASERAGRKGAVTGGRASSSLGRSSSQLLRSAQGGPPARSKRSLALVSQWTCVLFK